jgi:hypothetical protein
MRRCTATPAGSTPDRWAADYTRSEMRATFFPFGQGIRNCLGEGFRLSRDGARAQRHRRPPLSAARRGRLRPPGTSSTLVASVMMSWHDNAVHAVALEPAQDHPGRLLLDIDYILEGILPRAWDLTTDINLQGWSFQLFLDAIERSGPDEHGFFEWTLAGDHFSIGLSAPGFTQYLRRAPTRSPRYWLSVQERGGFSFGQEGYTR